MNLLNGAALFYLLTIPPVVLLYFLRLRRKNRTVPSTLLWDTQTADLQANAPFQRLRKSLLLILHVLLLVILTLLLARPFLKVKALTGESAIIVIDASASMQTTDENPSRIEAAKKAAKKLIGDISRGDEACVIEAGRRTRVREGFSSNRAALNAAIDAVEATDTETALKDAIALAVSLAKKKRDAAIVLISDGAFAPLEDVNLSGEYMRFVKVGKRNRNVGITAMDARRDYSHRGGMQLFIQLSNYNDGPAEFVLELHQDGQLIDAREVELPDKGSYGEVFADYPYEAGVVEARIDVEDDLAVDNSGFAHLQPRGSSTVRLVTKGDVFLQKALGVDPRVQVLTVEPADYDPNAEFDVTVFDGWAPERLSDGNYLLIHTAAENAPVQVTGTVAVPSVVRWDERHPVTQYASFDDVAVAEALSVQTRPWGVTLVDGDTTPLVVCGKQGGIRAIFIGFPLRRSNLPLRAAFPILMQNCLDWLQSERQGVASRSLQTGDAIALGSADAAEGLTVTDPNGKDHRVGGDGRSSLFDATEQVGLYRVKRDGDLQSVFVANLLSPAESNLEPRSDVTIGDRDISGGSSVMSSNMEIWRHLAVVGLLILCLEWYAYHRRI